METITLMPQLSSPHDWIQWFSMIKTTAMDQDVWLYCNPDTSEEFNQPNLSEQLTATQERLYTLKLNDYERKRKGLAKVNSIIQGTVCKDYQTYLEDAHTPRQRLKTLRSAIKPSVRQVEDSVREEYDSLIKGPKRISIDKWLNRWIALAPRLRALSIPNLGEAQACRGFIQATETVNPAFYNSMISHVGMADSEVDRIDQLKAALKLMRDHLHSSNEGSSGDTISASPAWHTAFDSHLEAMRDEKDPSKLTLASLVGRFKQMQPSKQAIKQSTKASFATLQGRKHTQDDSDEPSSDRSDDAGEPSSRSRKKPRWASKAATSSAKPAVEQAKPQCICGDHHRYAKCWYLAPQLAPPSWQPIDTTKAKLIRQVHGNKQLKDKVERALRYANVTPPDWFSRTEARKAPDTVLATGRAAFTSQRQAMSTVTNTDRRFFLDSCSNSHICADIERFTTITPTNAERLKAGDFYTTIQGTGTVTITVSGSDGPFEIDLHNVAYCLGFHMNLVSYHKLKAKGVRWNDEIEWLTRDGRPYIKVIDEAGWPLIEQDSSPSLFAMATSTNPLAAKASIDRWHARLGHPRLEVLQQLPHHVQGVTYTTIDSSLSTALCPQCIEGQQRQQIQRTTTYPGAYPFERVHFDILEIEKAFNIDRWVLHFYCVYSGFHVAFTLPFKNGPQMTDATETFIKLIQAWGYTIREMQSDNERGLNEQWRELLRINGITHRKSPPFTPSQNGAAERSGGVITAIARKLYLESKLPISLWPFFIDQAVRIINRLPIQRKKWITPYELVHGRQPNLAGFRVIGSKAYVLIKNKQQRPQLHKLRSKSIIGYLLGVPSANIFIVWIPRLNRAIYTRDVVIDEKHRWSSDNEETHALSIAEFTSVINEVDLDDDELDQVQASEGQIQQGDSEQTSATQMKEQHARPQPVLTPPISEPDDDHPVQGENLTFTSPTTPTTPTSAPLVAPASTLPSLPAPPEPHAPAAIAAQQHPNRVRHPTAVDALQNLRSRTGRTITPSNKAKQAASGAHALKRTHDEHSSRKDRHNYTVKYLKLDSGIRQAFASASAQSMRRHLSQLPPEPDNWKEMLKHSEAEGFKAAAQAEMDQHKLNNTWVETTMPTDCQVLPLRWVFKYKSDPEGYLAKHKARLCVRGDLQWPTYEDIYAATGAYRTLRILLSIVAAFNLICEKGDIKNAFTKAPINRPVFTHTAPGYPAQGKAYVLKQALYGLKVSPKLWYTELSAELKSLGLQPCPDEPCLFIHPKEQILIFIYVDDLLFIAHPSRRASLTKLQQELDRKYGIQGLGPADSFLNIRIIRDHDAGMLSILQDTYIESIARKFGQNNSARRRTPLSSSFKAQPYTGLASPDQIMAFQQRIGSILYPAIITRPDIAFAASILAQFSQNPSPEHLVEANHVISYLYHTRYLAIQFICHIDASAQSDEVVFKASSDASFADDAQTRRSSQGYLLSLFNGPVAWQSSKQKTVVTSTTEAELLSLSYAAREVISIIRLFSQIGLDIEHQPSLQCDNQQTVNLIISERPQITTKLKHIDINRHWVREQHQAGTIDVEWTPTAEMPADGFTKRLAKGKHASFITALCMRDLIDQLNHSTDLTSSSSESDNDHMQ